MKTKNSIIIINLLLIIIISSGCSALEQIANYDLERLDQVGQTEKKEILSLPESDYVKDRIELVSLNPKSLNPLDENLYDVNQVLMLMYESIFNIQDDYQLSKGVIDSYDKTSDKIYRFHLKDKTFHTGQKLKAVDVAFSYNYILENKQSPYYYVTDYIESIRVLDDLTFDVKFKELNVNNLWSLTFPIICQSYVESDSYDPMVAVGSGPYRFVDFQDMVYLQMEANKAYEDQVEIPKVYVSIVRSQEEEYNMFQSKRIDVYAPLQTEWTLYSDDESISRISYDSPYFYYLGFNHNEDTWKDLNYRRLMAGLIPYEEINRVAFLNHLDPVPFPMISGHYLYQDMDQYYAKMSADSYYGYMYRGKSLTAYIAKLRKTYMFFDQEPIVLNLIYIADDYYQEAIASVLEKSFSSHYILLNLQGLSKEDYQKRLEKRDYDLFIASIQTGIRPEFNSIFSSGASLNYGDFSSLNVDGLLSTYYKVNNDEQFAKQLENLSKVFSEELPIIPLGYLENGMFIHDQLQGEVKPNFYNQYYGFWEMKTKG